MCLWHWRQLHDPFPYKFLKWTYYERFTFSVFAKILWNIWSHQPMDWIVRQYSQFFVGYLGQTTWDLRSHSGSGLLLTWHGISFECPTWSLYLHPWLESYLCTGQPLFSCRYLIFFKCSVKCSCFVIGCTDQHSRDHCICKNERPLSFFNRPRLKKEVVLQSGVTEARRTNCGWGGCPLFF